MSEFEALQQYIDGNSDKTFTDWTPERSDIKADVGYIRFKWLGIRPIVSIAYAMRQENQRDEQ